MKRKSKNILVPLGVIVGANYIAQIPYGIHQYHGHYNLFGLCLLFITFLWFNFGYWLVFNGIKKGYWILVSFLLVQSIFYFHNEVLLAMYGYGMLYHFQHSKDWLLWIVFLIGDVNFITACGYSFYLLINKQKIINS